MESKNKKNLGTRILLLKRKRKRDEIKIKTAKKYQKLERDCSYLLTKEKERSKELSEYKAMQTDLTKLQSVSHETKPEWLCKRIIEIEKWYQITGTGKRLFVELIGWCWNENIWWRFWIIHPQG